MLRRRCLIALLAPSLEAPTDVACLTLQRFAKRADGDAELCVGMSAPPVQS